MTTIFLDINDKIYIVKCLTYNPTTKSYKTDMEKLQTAEKAIFFVLQNLELLHLSKILSGTLLQQKLWAFAKRFE